MPAALPAIALIPYCRISRPQQNQVIQASAGSSTQTAAMALTGRCYDESRLGRSKLAFSSCRQWTVRIGMAQNNGAYAQPTLYDAFKQQITGSGI